MARAKGTHALFVHFFKSAYLRPEIEQFKKVVNILAQTRFDIVMLNMFSKLTLQLAKR